MPFQFPCFPQGVEAEHWVLPIVQGYIEIRHIPIPSPDHYGPFEKPSDDRPRSDSSESRERSDTNQKENSDAAAIPVDTDEASTSPAGPDAAYRETTFSSEACEELATVPTIGGDKKEEEKEEIQGLTELSKNGSSTAHVVTCEDSHSWDSDDIANGRFDSFPLVADEEESDVPEQKRLWRQSQMLKEEKGGGLPKVAIAIISRRSRHRAGGY